MRVNAGECLEEVKDEASEGVRLAALSTMLAVLVAVANPAMARRNSWCEKKRW
jgi:hypothetical protein